MIRLLTILFFFSVLSNNSYSQEPKVKKPEGKVITEAFDDNQNPLKDTALFYQLAKIYGDSVLTIVDSLLKDTAFLKSIGDTSIFGFGELPHLPVKSNFPFGCWGGKATMSISFQPAKYGRWTLLSVNLRKKLLLS